MQAVIPRPDVAPLLQEHFVALAADCDHAELEVEQIAMQLEDAMMLPFVLVADAEGNYVTGSSGYVEPAALITMLQDVIGDPT